LSQWAPGGRGPRCPAPAAPMVVTPLLIGPTALTVLLDSTPLLEGPWKQLSYSPSTCWTSLLIGMSAGIVLYIVLYLCIY